MQNKKPMILVLAGPNGSGKSTITAFFEKVGKYTNADDIVMATGMDNMEAAKLVDKMRYDSINNIKELLDICDIMHVYDNTETPKRIIRKHKDDLSIYPNEYWSEQAILELFG